VRRSIRHPVEGTPIHPLNVNSGVQAESGDRIEYTGGPDPGPQVDPVDGSTGAERFVDWMAPPDERHGAANRSA
jgi:hypothetical protein